MAQSPIRFETRGDFDKTLKWLKRLSEERYLDYLEKYAKLGVEALAEATPKRTGRTAASWTYTIERNAMGSARINWHNTNVQDHVNIALIIQYGHGTRNGGYVEGVDYINPALQPIFEQLAQDAWEEVTNVGNHH